MEKNFKSFFIAFFNLIKQIFFLRLIHIDFIRSAGAKVEKKPFSLRKGSGIMFLREYKINYLIVDRTLGRCRIYYKTIPFNIS
jgi:hypothetical protein